MRSNVREANFHSASLLKKDEEGMGVDLMDLSGDLIKIAEKPRRDAVEYITDGKGKIRIMGALADAGRTGYPADRIRYFFRDRSEEHTSELQSLMRISYAVFCLKKK